MIIISDFSKTFTRSDMPTTWSVFAKSGILDPQYAIDRDALYTKYVHFEQEGNIEKTEKWFLDHAQLFAKYYLTQDQINQVVMDDRYFAPRAGVRELLDYIRENNIPLVIVTSGVSNFVTTWFQKRFDYVPEVVFGTELILENGIVCAVDTETVICPLDKTVNIEFDHGEESIMIIGDNTEDIAVVKNPKLSIGFTDEDRGFDIQLGKEGSMTDVIGHLK